MNEQELRRAYKGVTDQNSAEIEARLVQGDVSIGVDMASEPDFTSLAGRNADNEWAYAMLVPQLLAFVEAHPGVTTPEIAERFKCSVTFARWAVHEVPMLEYYDGNHVRVKEGDRR